MPEVTAGDIPGDPVIRRKGASPFFSICIPQYNRTDFLIAACRSYISQSFQDFELCISDDCSTDGRTGDFLRFLDENGVSYAFVRTERNLRYDGNLRSAISLSIGQYVLLMGNDDALSDTGVLQTLHDEILRHQPVTVAVTNYREWESGAVNRRVIGTRVVGAGPETAVATFRRYSFVSGIVFDGDAARREASPVCDGSEMYQMYLGTRLVAAGGRFLAIDRICVDKDLQIPGQAVDSYRQRPRISSFPLVERRLPLSEIFRVVAGGLEPYHSGAVRARNLTEVAQQLYRFIFPFWTIEFRRIHSWGYALGVLLGVRPSRLAQGVELTRSVRRRFWSSYLLGGLLGLMTPLTLFDRLRPWLYAKAKQLRRRQELRAS